MSGALLALGKQKTANPDFATGCGRAEPIRHPLLEHRFHASA